MPDFTSPIWEATYPEGWTSEEADESILFYDSEAEAGTLQISCFCKEDPVTEQDLLELAEDSIGEGRRWGKVQVGELEGIMFRFYEGEEAWKEWYLGAGQCAFFITYDCPREAEGVEDEEVAQILESIRLPRA